GSMASTRSVSSRSGTRLVTTTVSCGQLPSSTDTNEAAPSSTVSHPSRTRSVLPRAARWPATASDASSMPSGAPRFTATVPPTRASSPTAPRATQNRPPGNPPAERATCAASRDLPTPPRPTSVASPGRPSASRSPGAGARSVERADQRPVHVLVQGSRLDGPARGRDGQLMVPKTGRGGRHDLQRLPGQRVDRGPMGQQPTGVLTLQKLAAGSSRDRGDEVDGSAVAALGFSSPASWTARSAER